MAEQARNPDIVDRHIQLEGRVRALETGVHPVNADIQYLGYVIPTVIDKESGMAGTGRWRMQQGVIHFDGRASVTWSTSALWGKVPKEAWPTQEMTFMCAWRPGEGPSSSLGTRVTVNEYGEVVIYNDSGSSGSYLLDLSHVVYVSG